MASTPAATALPHSQAGAASASAVLPALAAVFLGLFVVGVAGFSQIDVVHNAAHNTRHVNAFPCH